MRIFVTTCSRNKIEGGKRYSCFEWRNERKAALLATRAQVLAMMSKGELSSGLRVPAAGPDFGGREENGQYLPAHKRYHEGSFMKGLLASKRKLTEWHKTNRIYFVSALYGLAGYNEPIQNYDLRLSSELVSLWIEQARITDMLLQGLKHIKGESLVVNCCGDTDYGSLINWELIEDEGHSVRHARGRGELEGGQIRWVAGHLAGERGNQLQDLFDYEECQYTSANGTIMLARRLPSNAIVSSGLSLRFEETSSGKEYEMPVIAVAIHRVSQKNAFMTHARKRGWPQIAKFEFIDNLSKESLGTLHEHGVRTLIVHIDDTHAHIKKAYKADDFDLIPSLPKSWECRKVKNERYSDIELERKVGFSLRR